jgi:signal transduction histidine kinase
MKNPTLRQQAEDELGKQASALIPITGADTLRLLHELQVHQIELEMQNEELVQARAEAEEAYRQYTDLYDFAPVGYFTLARDGTISKVNLAGANLLELRRVDLLTRRLGMFTSDESHSAFNAFFDKLLTGEGKKNCELMFDRKEDAPLWVCLEATCFEGGQECRVVMMDISQRKQAEELLGQYTGELEQRVEERTAELIRANHAKDQFLAIMSHELRTPLNGILTGCQLLLEGVHKPLNEKQESTVNIMYSSGKYLLGLIVDILDVARIESGKFEIYPEVANAHEICQSSLDLMKPLADKKSIIVEYVPTSNAVTIFADPKCLKQILVNLLNNAVKFTPAKGTIKLEVQADAKASLMRFSITDTGIGIRPQDLQKIFDPFVQLDNGLSRHYEGSGLGLALVKKLVDLHSGNLEVQSEIGKGSCFSFTLPWSGECEW